ncbi:hypothetical protein V5O48_011838 [Marasmius crinis-equi]|uniref:Fatty acid desaturase domain-containing protein n=1 Tax=Marasmius crinis-equi TaxID=585013 RepID=A0ABR3F4N3_9AGAR
MSFFSSLFHDGPEYERRKKTPFVPPKVTLSEIRAVVPKHLHDKNTAKGLSFIVRDGTLAFLSYKLAAHIPRASLFIATRVHNTALARSVVSGILWSIHWQCQGILFTSLWCLAHEASHGNISPRRWINDAVGFFLHTLLLVPYFPWKSSHSAHHKATVSLERDVNYVPPTRSDFKLPPEPIAHPRDYQDILEETPIYTFYRMFLMQTLGLMAYLAFNTRGSPRYPPGTSHFDPHSLLFKPHERNGIIASDVGLIVTLAALCWWTSIAGLGQLIRLYLVPWMLTNHWIIMLTYLHHSDPTIPYYRQKEWSFLRGALATVDRPLLGWIGRVFFHNVSHNHISHHIFSDIPFYNQPETTACIKKVLKSDYNFDSTNTFRALYRNFVQCEFVEDEGDIVFYKNREGEAARFVAET